MPPHDMDVGRSVPLSVVERRQQDTAFQVFKGSLEFDTPALQLPIQRFDDILGRHGPSWAKRAAQPAIS